MNTEDLGSLPFSLLVARRTVGLRRKEVAVLVEITKQDLRRLEDGAAEPTVGVLCRLADALNTSTDYLLGRSDYLLDPALYTGLIPPKEKAQ